jgi:hypothetical protein
MQFASGSRAGRNGTVRGGENAKGQDRIAYHDQM